MERITAITEHNTADYPHQSGYKVITDKQEIELTGKALSKAVMKKNCEDHDSKYFEGGIMFVDLKTSKGTLQFVAYNQHNGYYGHDAVVKSTQLTHEESL